MLYVNVHSASDDSIRGMIRGGLRWCVKVEPISTKLLYTIGHAHVVATSPETKLHTYLAQSVSRNSIIYMLQYRHQTPREKCGAALHGRCPDPRHPLSHCPTSHPSLQLSSIPCLVGRVAWLLSGHTRIRINSLQARRGPRGRACAPPPPPASASPGSSRAPSRSPGRGGSRRA